MIATAWLAVKTWFGGLPVTALLIGLGVATAGGVALYLYHAGEHAEELNDATETAKSAVDLAKPVPDSELERVRKEYERP